MGLAHAGRARISRVSVAPDPGPGGERLDPAALHRRLESEVEVLQRLSRWAGSKSFSVVLMRRSSRAASSRRAAHRETPGASPAA